MIWIFIITNLIFISSFVFYYYKKNYLLGITNRLLHIFILSGCMNYLIFVISVILFIYYTSDLFPLRSFLWAFVAGGNLFLAAKEKHEFEEENDPNKPVI